MSITLSAGAIQTVTKGGTTIETNNAAAVINQHFDFQANTLSWEVDAGVMSGGVFTPGAHGDRITVVVDLATGNWFASAGQFGAPTGQAGTFPGGTLAGIVTLAKQIRNALEGYVIAGSLFPGTAVPWT